MMNGRTPAVVACTVCTRGYRENQWYRYCPGSEIRAYNFVRSVHACRGRGRPGKASSRVGLHARYYRARRAFRMYLLLVQLLLPTCLCVYIAPIVANHRVLYVPPLGPGFNARMWFRPPRTFEHVSVRRPPDQEVFSHHALLNHAVR